MHLLCSSFAAFRSRSSFMSSASEGIPGYLVMVLAELPVFHQFCHSEEGNTDSWFAVFMYFMVVWIIFNKYLLSVWVTQWCGWLRHCATSQKVMGLIPDGVIGIFPWHNPSGCTMALGPTEPLNRNEYRWFGKWWSMIYAF
jgi:hypothetical protein